MKKLYRIEIKNKFGGKFVALAGFDKIPKSYSSGAWRMLRSMYSMEEHFRYVRISASGDILEIVDEWKSPKAKTS